MPARTGSARSVGSSAEAPVTPIDVEPLIGALDEAPTDVPLGTSSPVAGDVRPHGGPSAGDALVLPSGPSDGAIAEVHARLSRFARDCYPERARRFRQTARVPLSFCVDATGRAERIHVGRSGVEALDEATRTCVLGKAEPLPDGAMGHCFSVAVEFGG